MTSKTKILFISHIASPTAVRLPVEELCKRAKSAGIISFIDGAHVPGHMDIDLSKMQADMYCGNLHKWMCTPKGTSFLWVSTEWKDKITPLCVSWGHLANNVGDGFFINEQEFLGTRDYSMFLSITRGLQWMQENDWPTIQKRNRLLKTFGI